ncbi:MAG: efflux RND transporter periplasmic adaptor subunit [Bacillota bacterium]
MKRKTWIYLGIAVLVVAGIAAAAGARGGKELETVRVKKGNIVREVADTGYVQAAESYDLHATQNARVAEVPVKVGQTIAQGRSLVVLENLDLAMQIDDVRSRLSQAAIAAEGARAGLGRAEAELRDANDNLARVQELLEAEAASQLEYDKARLQAEVCAESVKELSSQLDGIIAQGAGLRKTLAQLEAKERQLVVRSPLAGTVLDLPVKQEQVVGPGTLLAIVAAPDQLEVKADILSDDLGEVKTGQRAAVTAPVLGDKTLSGHVVKIYPRAEEKTSALGVVQRRVPVIIALDYADALKPGYEVRVAIETLRRENVLVLPRESVRTWEDGRREVIAVVGGHVRYRLVETGISGQNNIEITGGLKAGDLVILDGSLDLAENAKVEPMGK